METQIEKPSFDEVYSYATKSIAHAIFKNAYYFPNEIKEELEQEAMLRVWKAYQVLDVSKGWKSFIQLHCTGAVLDYLKKGEQSTEAEVELEQLQVINRENDDGPLSVEEIAGIFEDHFEGEIKKSIDPNWELISKMACKDENLHIVAKILLGFSQDAIAKQFEVAYSPEISRERISQKYHEFFKKLDSPEFINDPWVNQCIYALGLSDIFKQAKLDNGLGWDLPSIDLSDTESFKTIRKMFAPSIFDVIDLDQ